MKILTFYNFNNICSVSLKNNEKISSEINFVNKNSNFSILFIINKILFKNSLTIKDIDIISFSNGPGSFTAIRTSIVLAKGLSIGSNSQLMNFSMLEIYAYKAKKITCYKNFLIILKANKKNLYFGKYILLKNNLVLKKKEIFLSNKSAYKKIKMLKKKWIIVKNFNSILFNKIKKKKILNINNISALDIIFLTLKKIKLKKKINNNIIFPNYLNNTMIKKNK
ncbi:MAG: tRNA (adenosine(37)-N6)-threonylcarbamoyltransferase complex dimerization subunit type 1 TsaB [Buchnera aphidicola (Periphyllus aceris)]|nr:tRNA (adenosine(37)-N6)-threonylcarbamoyltransferase complex dimerization subunit type 1 TsaB [Buchnera aphidicola (Periphyllus aceris)]